MVTNDPNILERSGLDPTLGPYGPTEPTAFEAQAVREWILYASRFKNGTWEGPRFTDEYAEIVVVEKDAFTNMKLERDRYAKAMAVAMRDGIFFEKERTKAEIERILGGAE